MSLLLNARFRAGPPGGVARVAALHASGLARRLGGLEEVTPHAGENGWLWEQVSLRSAARGRMLLGFANLGPLYLRDQIVMIHDAQPFLAPGDYRLRQRVNFRLIWRNLAANARLILTVSEHSRQALARAGVTGRAPVAVVPNGADHLQRVPARQPRGFKEAGPFALMIGSSKGYKNLARAVRGWRRAAIDGGRLVIAGGPDPATYLGDAPVTWVPRPSDGEVRWLYQHARLFILPSLTEGFGLPGVEAMAEGCPVAAARAGAMPEVLDDAATWFDPHSEADIATALSTLWAWEGVRTAQIARGKDRVAALSWSRAEERLYQALAPYL